MRHQTNRFAEANCYAVYNPDTEEFEDMDEYDSSFDDIDSWDDKDEEFDDECPLCGEPIDFCVCDDDEDDDYDDLDDEEFDDE